MTLRSLISQFVLFFFITIFMWVGITYVSQNIQYTNAKQFYDEVIRQLEYSYFDEDTIQVCKAKAKERGCVLQVGVYESENNKDAKVTLLFEFVTPVIQIKREYKLEGYAR